MAIGELRENRTKPLVVSTKCVPNIKQNHHMYFFSYVLYIFKKKNGAMSKFGLSAAQKQYANGVALFAEGDTFKSANDLPSALGKYVMGLASMEFARKYHTVKPFVASITALISKYTSIVDELKEQLAVSRPANNVTKPPQKTSSIPLAGNTHANTAPPTTQDASDMINIDSAIVTSPEKITFDDIAGCKAAKQIIGEAILLPLRFPLFCKQNKLKPWKGMLLYGPPGTGKTMLAKAMAYENQCTFFSVNSSMIMSKFVGDSEQKVRAIFAKARQMAPSIIFFDEADGLLSPRSDNSGSEVSHKVKNEILSQIDGIPNGKQEDNDPSTVSVFVVGATNNPMGIDEAMMRRFEKRVYIPLPDVETRAKILEINLMGLHTDIERSDIETLSNELDGYSGADIKILVKEAVAIIVRLYTNATWFIQRVVVGSGDEWIPAKENDNGAVQKRFTDFADGSFGSTCLSISHLRAAMLSVKPSTGSEGSRMFAEFTAKHGEK